MKARLLDALEWIIAAAVFFVILAALASCHPAAMLVLNQTVTPPCAPTPFQP